MNKLYSVHDHWTDINKKNDVDIESIDGVITGIKVNGEDYGGGGGSWQTVFEGVVTTVAQQIGEPTGKIEGLTEITADTIKVTFNGTEYTCEKVDDGYGDSKFTEYPFFIDSWKGSVLLLTKTAGTYTLKIEEE